MNEREIQKKAVDHLRQAGFTVIVTSNRKKTANTKGAADIFVNIYRSVWIALDTKTPTGKLSEEQQKLVDEGKVYIFTEPYEALDICITARKAVL